MIITSCIKNDKENNSEKAIKLNKTIAKQIFDYNSIQSKDEKKLYQILNLVSKAIELDNKNIFGYVNEASIYIKLGKYRDARLALQKIIELKKDYPELYLFIGILYEKEGDLNNAIENYKKALAMFNDKLSMDKNNIDIEFNIIISKIFVNSMSKQTALKEVEKFSKGNVDKQKMELMKQTIINFNKEDFLKNISN